MKITRQQQAKLAGRIAHLYLKVTLDLINRGCKTPAKIAPWVELNGIHSFIPVSWEDSSAIEIGPRQAKNIIAAAKTQTLEAIRHLDQYEPIRNHLAAMKGKDISGQPLLKKNPGYVIAEWGRSGRGFLKSYKSRAFPDGRYIEWTEDASKAKIFPTKRGAKVKAKQLHKDGHFEGPIAIGSQHYNNIVKSFEPTA